MPDAAGDRGDLGLDTVLLDGVADSVDGELKGACSDRNTEYISRQLIQQLAAINTQLKTRIQKQYIPHCGEVILSGVCCSESA